MKISQREEKIDWRNAKRKEGGKGEKRQGKKKKKKRQNLSTSNLKIRIFKTCKEENSRFQELKGQT